MPLVADTVQTKNTMSRSTKSACMRAIRSGMLSFVGYRSVQFVSLRDASLVAQASKSDFRHPALSVGINLADQLLDRALINVWSKGQNCVRTYSVGAGVLNNRVCLIISTARVVHHGNRRPDVSSEGLGPGITITSRDGYVPQSKSVPLGAYTLGSRLAPPTQFARAGCK